MCSDPCDQAALFLDRQLKGNECRELKCLALEHPGEEERSSKHAADAGLQNALICLHRRTPHCNPKHTLHKR